MIWHRKVPPSGLWVSGSASTWQWRAREHLHLPRNATAHRAACTNSHNHFGAQTRRLRSGYVDWRCYDGAQSARGYVRASGYGVALGRCAILSLPSLHLPQDSHSRKSRRHQSKRCLPVDYVLMHLLLGLATRTARPSTIRQEDSEWVDELRQESASPSIESAWIYIFWTEK